MTEFDKTNRGAIFVNDKKQEGSKQPDRTGSLNVDGVEYFLDGWLKKSNSGQAFMSLSVKRKDKQPQAAQRPRQQSAPVTNAGFSDMNDDVPF